MKLKASHAIDQGLIEREDVCVHEMNDGSERYMGFTAN